jgi:hypothetical protein
MSSASLDDVRVFKSSWFAKAASKARISDTELCQAVGALIAGQGIDLGGGVFKKRLNQNRHRSIILAKGGRYWICQFLFAKKDRSNIDDQELKVFRELARAYANLSASPLAQLIAAKDLIEICHEGADDQVKL